jgi:hypothetical protein
MEILLILGIVGWIFGYLAARGVFTIKETDPYWGRFIIVPRWLYYICGAPKSSSHPEGSIMARILGGQLSSIVIAIYSLICLSGKISPGWLIFGLFAGGAVPYLIVYYYSKIARS